MVARAEAELGVEDESVKSEAELLDVLYEVLAQGVPPGSKITSADVERFLHEHARCRKSMPEMLAFFEQHGLSTKAGDYGADPELSQLASGLHRERLVAPVAGFESDVAAPEPPTPAESGPVRRALPAPVALDQEPVEEGSTVRTRTPASKNTQRGLIVALALVALGSLVGVGLSFQRGQVLQGDLQRANLQLRATDDALTALELRAEGLRGALAQSESERAALAGRFEAFSNETRREREAEAEVLKRMLGKRYETLRNQALSEIAPPQGPAPAP